MDKFQIKQTSDGSHTLYVPELNETYHSTHGALQEALHVFIENGIKRIDNDKITVLEVGFGTGLNAILTSQFAKDSGKNITYVGLETIPIHSELIKKLDYVSLNINLSKEDYNAIHESSWEVENRVNDNFKLIKRNISVQEFITDRNIDLIYYDAFGPRAQIEMWDKAIFEKLYSQLELNGLLVTYCAMGQFKRDLRAVGFEVENVPGPPGKREMTLAFKR